MEEGHLNGVMEESMKEYGLMVKYCFSNLGK